jgi:hypothetical protein
MDRNEAVVRAKIVRLLENAFITRRAIDPEEVAKKIAPSVDLPLPVVIHQVTAIAKRLGVKVLVR